MADLPKFLLADDADDEHSPTWLVHTQPPRFIARVGEHNGEQILEPRWQDSPENFSDATLRELMQQASAYLRRALDE